MAKKPAPALRADDVTARQPALAAQQGPRVGAPDGEASTLGVEEMPDGSAEVEFEDSVLPEIEELPDGSAVVREPEPEKKASLDGDNFYENLAAKIDSAERSDLARRLLEAIERDKEDRTERDKLYAEGLKRTGMGGDAPGGAEFEGASRAVHPMLIEGCVDFAARVMKEIFPPNGPVKTQIIGKSNRSKLERAERKRQFMNWQCTKQVRELRPSVETLLTQVPLGGSQYIKIWHDPRYGRPRAEFVPIDKFFIPAAAADLYSAARKTHQQDITRLEFEARIASGLYDEATVVNTDSATLPEKSEAEKANDKIQGVAETGYNEDGLRTVYETYVLLELDSDPKAPKGRVAPYIATVDESSNQLLALYRNWEEDDPLCLELEWVVEGTFIPWRGPQGIGLMHLAGSLAGAATGAMRALLDSALIANFPGALALKGAGTAGQAKSAGPTEITQLESPAGVDDIRKLVMPFPFPGPSAVLFELLKFTVESGKGVINTAEEKIADASSTAPVGTTLAMIEQGSLTYSSIHSRMHGMMERILAILHRLDAKHLDDEMTVAELGDLNVSRADFEGPMDVVPVSDPNIFSETQRYAQLQAVLMLRGQFQPGSFKDSALLEQSLRLLHFPGYEDVLNTPLEAEERNALDENVVASNPQATLEVYELQDHLSHLKTHVRFMASPVFCANPMMAPIALPKLLEHCRKHLLAYYQENVKAAADAMMPRLAELGIRGDNSDEVLEAATSSADKKMAEELQEIFPVIQQLQQQLQQLIPPPPMPEMGVEQIRQQGETQRLQAREQAETAREQQRQALEDQREQRREAAEKAREDARAQAEAARHTEEMAVAARNAEIAEQSERDKQEREQAMAQFRELMENVRETQRNQTDIIVAQMKEVTARIQAQEDRVAAEAATAAESAKQNEAKATESDDTMALLVQAMTSILKAQTTPRQYAINKDPATGQIMLKSFAGGETTEGT